LNQRNGGDAKTAGATECTEPHTLFQRRRCRRVFCSLDRLLIFFPYSTTANGTIDYSTPPLPRPLLLVPLASYSNNIHFRSAETLIMANFFQSPPPQQQPHYGGGGTPNNLQFYPSTYSSQTQSPPGYGFGGMGSIQPGGGAVGSGSREHGLTKGWLAAFGTGGYDDEPPLLEELGVNFGHIKMKVLTSTPDKEGSSKILY